MRIICDVDGVVADLHSEWLRRYNEDYNDTLTAEDIRHWDMRKNVKEECGAAIYDYLHHTNLYTTVAPIPGALAGVSALRGLGHEVVFATNNVYGMTDQKARWLERNGFATPNRYDTLPQEVVVLRDKSILTGALMIEDAPHHAQAWVDTGRRCVLLAAAYNSSDAMNVHSAFWLWCQRLDTWADIVAYVEQLWNHQLRGR